ncbi:glycosyltransferase [Acinetobacter junii]|uniref:glycosyltransferase n=1 Tax=Acinetobacter junii TaxID=40215 RepID=UPI00143C827D|nr:glycosyltransferase [Acinetobacter junii]NKG35987.1 hypothetical protein [Acinetobacter junii]
MKLLYLITGLGMGGAEKVVVDLADSMVNLGHQVTLVYLVEGAMVIPESSKIDLIFLDLKANPISAFLKFIKILDVKQPDVVHSNMYHANVFSRIARIFKPFPKLICTSHSDFEGGRLRMLVYFLTSPLMTIATNVSEQAKNKLVQAGALKSERMLVVNNSIDINKFKANDDFRNKYRLQFNLKSKEICFLAVGRFHPAKDYSTLIKIFKELNDEYDNLRLFIVGDGALRASIESEIKFFCLEDKVTLLGIRHDIPELMNMCDIFISTSAWEGFGLVLAEAMACSKVVVASNNAGFLEILGKNSPYLAKIGNVDSFCKILKEILSKSDKELAEIGNINRRIIVENYASHIILKKWLKLYIEK